MTLDEFKNSKIRASSFNEATGYISLEINAAIPVGELKLGPGVPAYCQDSKPGPVSTVVCKEKQLRHLLDMIKLGLEVIK